MKKIIPILLVGVLVLSGLGAVATIDEKQTDIISQKQTFSNPIISDIGTYLTVELEEATSYLMGEEKLELPFVTNIYTFPFGTKIDNVEVIFSDTYKQIISKEIKPASIPRYISTELNEKTSHETVESKETSLKENIYPENQFSYNIGAGLDGKDHVIYLSVQYFPITYHPNEDTLYISKNVEVKISYTPVYNPITFLDEYDLLIIAPAVFSEELQPLIDYKNDNEIATVLTTLEEIPSQGLDVQEDIKYYIKDSFENWGITYVILVGGGVTGEEIFPVRNAWVPSGGYEEYFPSDLYYADFYDGSMGFSDWDADDDGRYAEFPDDNNAVDMYPDVYLGRLACNDESEVTNVVNKIINFMQHNSVMNKIVQMGGDTFPGDDEGIYEGEFCNDVVMDNLPGYSTERLWGSNEQLSKLNIIKAINNGVDFVDFSGHGSYQSWSTHPPEDESRWIPDDGQYNGFLYINVPWLFNSKKLPVVFLNACSNNKFSESPNCLGWAFIQNTNGGAIASYGASGIGYGSHGSSESERLFGWMEVNTLKGLVNDKILGDVWGSCISEYYNTFLGDLGDADYKTLYEYELFGDPSLIIDDGPEPESEGVFQPSLFLRILERLIERFPMLEQLLSFPFLNKLFKL
ncbi:MAG: hypothetical protein KAI20_00080 [Thermoplasmatales archaeon]|nr:hypothetical protein [Thermoplasmatales archaeon]